MAFDDFRHFLSWIRQIGGRPDLIQGSGGNFSCKTDERRMAIKASGYRFGEIDEERGLAWADYPTILGLLEDEKNAGLREEESVNLIMNGVRPAASGEKIRPSMEIGFHVFLDRFVIHTHSVYANILTCGQDGQDLFRKIFGGWSEPMLWLPYAQPGWALALSLRKAVLDFKKRFGFLPAAIFLENHGLIVNGADWRQLADLHERIEKALRKYFRLTASFPTVAVEAAADSEDIFFSATSYLQDFLQDNAVILENFSDHIIFPDQAVFCQDFGKKILFEKSRNRFFYNKISRREAVAIEETLTAWAFILTNIRAGGRNWQSLAPAAVAALTGMESEKYRRSLMADKK